MPDNLKECPICGSLSDSVARRHRNTAYVDEESNYLTACRECQDRDDEYFAERWAEYYSGRL